MNVIKEVKCPRCRSIPYSTKKPEIINKEYNKWTLMVDIFIITGVVIGLGYFIFKLIKYHG